MLQTNNLTNANSGKENSENDSYAKEKCEKEQFWKVTVLKKDKSEHEKLKKLQF